MESKWEQQKFTGGYRSWEELKIEEAERLLYLHGEFNGILEKLISAVEMRLVWNNQRCLINYGKDPLAPGAKSTNEEKSKHYREFRTVTLSGGRFTGKTYWILRNSDPKTMIITRADYLRDRFISQLQGFSKRDKKTWPTVVSHMQLREKLKDMTPEQKAVMPKFRRIIIDDASEHFDQFTRKDFYTEILPFCDAETIFIMLG